MAISITQLRNMRERSFAWRFCPDIGTANLLIKDLPEIIDTIIQQHEALKAAELHIYCDLGVECAEHGHWADCAIHLGRDKVREALALITEDESE